METQQVNGDFHDPHNPKLHAVKHVLFVVLLSAILLEVTLYIGGSIQ